MKLKLTLLMLFLSILMGYSVQASQIFVVEYEGYDPEPCGVPGCLVYHDMSHVDRTHVFCKDMKCIEKAIDRDTKHIDGMYRITWFSQDKTAKVTKLKLVPTFIIEDEETDNEYLDITDDSPVYVIPTGNVK